MSDTPAIPSDRETTPLTLTERLGVLVVRVVIPAWILAGCLLKFGSRDPSLMPKQFRSILHYFELDLKLSLAVLLVIEMFLMIRFARLGPSSLHTGRYHFELEAAAANQVQRLREAVTTPAPAKDAPTEPTAM